MLTKLHTIEASDSVDTSGRIMFDDGEAVWCQLVGDAAGDEGAAAETALSIPSDSEEMGWVGLHDPEKLSCGDAPSSPAVQRESVSPLTLEEELAAQMDEDATLVRETPSPQRPEPHPRRGGLAFAVRVRPQHTPDVAAASASETSAPAAEAPVSLGRVESESSSADIEDIKCPSPEQSKPYATTPVNPLLEAVSRQVVLHEPSEARKRG